MFQLGNLPPKCVQHGLHGVDLPRRTRAATSFAAQISTLLAHGLGQIARPPPHVLEECSEPRLPVLVEQAIRGESCVLSKKEYLLQLWQKPHEFQVQPDFILSLAGKYYVLILFCTQSTLHCYMFHSAHLELSSKNKRVVPSFAPSVLERSPHAQMGSNTSLKSEQFRKNSSHDECFFRLRHVGIFRLDPVCVVMWLSPRACVDFSRGPALLQTRRQIAQEAF